MQWMFWVTVNSVYGPDLGHTMFNTAKMAVSGINKAPSESRHCGKVDILERSIGWYCG